MRPAVRGVDVQPDTRCRHWHSPRDIVAIKLRCCGVYYACKDCHDALAAHAVAVWPCSDWDEKAILCGVCDSELTIRQYMDCANICPSCGAAFNPGCKEHHQYYFEKAE